MNEKKRLMEQSEDIAIFHKTIHVKALCPHCNEKNNIDVKQIKAECPMCRKPFEYDLSNEDSKEEITFMYMKLAWTKLRINDEFSFSATMRFKDQAEMAIKRLIDQGVELSKIKKVYNEKIHEDTFVYHLKRNEYLKAAKKVAWEESVKLDGN
jgi:hypothetical protein